MPSRPRHVGGQQINMLSHDCRGRDTVCSVADRPCPDADSSGQMGPCPLAARCPSPCPSRILSFAFPNSQATLAYSMHPSWKQWAEQVAASLAIIRQEHPAVEFHRVIQAVDDDFPQFL